MELPRKILIGDGVIRDLGNFVTDLGVKNVAIVSGAVVKARVGDQCHESLANSELKNVWFLTTAANMETVDVIQNEILKNGSEVIIGFGGGKSVDVAKTIAYNLNRPFISVPTSASHDGISSPFSSIKGHNKPHSIKTKTPIGVLADTRIIAGAPRRLLASGCGDLIAKVTAVKDWELARDKKGEYFGKYSSNLASMSAKIVMAESKSIGEDNDTSVRTVVEALISSGVAACIAGSSRPCSGAEHLFSHALDFISPNQALHGEKCGIGAIMIAKLHDIEWEYIASTLKDTGAPITAKEIGIDADTVVKALIIASTLRPERYTILNKISLMEQDALELAKSTGVI
ncbi:MAG: NAD(P)-dependent glycerol-1-phosphate dehydrogenase [Thaumarchaeota archaeon]|nr:NAD(P)-dependent glycerol-1-phosphate dehydrogenase [Nitrososphaerota archaeon]|tara:strand:+ start:764 stop:1795 length:1032 start_codon:yes stop_codon:yes gene_type:complete